MLDASKKVLLREGKPLALTPTFSRRGRSDGTSLKALTDKSFVIRTPAVREVAGSKSRRGQFLFDQLRNHNLRGKCLTHRALV